MSERKEDDVAKFHALEQEGLQRADGRDSPAKGDADWFIKIGDATSQMAHHSRDVGEERWSNFIYAVNNAAHVGRLDASNCQMTGEKRKDCPTRMSTENEVLQMDNYYGAIPAEEKPPPATKRCTHLAGVVDPYPYHVLINDITACFHRSIEHYEESTKAWHKEGKCMWRE